MKLPTKDRETLRTVLELIEAGDAEKAGDMLAAFLVRH